MSPVDVSRRARQRGFTLIEMAVVLLVIGLILGAVSIGRDLQRQAEYKSIAQKFVYQWKVAYDAYYEKAGVVLGDSQIAPTFAVNGNSVHPTLFNHGTNVYTPGTAGEGGGALELPNRICEGTPLDDWQGEEDDIRPVQAGVSLHALMKSMGIRMPPGRAEGREDRYVYLDTNGNPQEIAVCFQWNPPYTPSNSGNVMVIVGLIPDLARMIDQMIDGKADAREGMFRQQGIANDASDLVTGGSNPLPNNPGIVWGAINSQNWDADARDFDEDQIITITAHWKMNQ